LRSAAIFKHWKKEAGYETIVYDNFSTGHRDAVFSDHLAVGEISDKKNFRVHYISLMYPALSTSQL
jgi:UDP-glucose 4-epimerase|tara:strand:+ start:44 stop:241 length:198 start_codon:yes stop_codon:yes gene_type:complete